MQFFTLVIFYITKRRYSHVNYYTQKCLHFYCVNAYQFCHIECLESSLDLIIF